MCDASTAANALLDCVKCVEVPVIVDGKKFNGDAIDDAGPRVDFVFPRNVVSGTCRKKSDVVAILNGVTGLRLEQCFCPSDRGARRKAWRHECYGFRVGH